MKLPMKRLFQAILVFSIVAVVGAQAKAIRKNATKSHSKLGDAVRLSKNIKFDGSNVDGVKSGKFDSFSLLDEGNGGIGKRKLYGIPGNFATRTVEENKEMGYRQ